MVRTESSDFSLIGSARDANSRTVWHLPLVIGIPLLRWSAGPFITAPFMYPDIDHEALLRPILRPNKSKHPIMQALKWQKMLDADKSLTQSKLADKQGFSRARVCQIMRLLSLPKEVQEALMDIEDPKLIGRLSERKMREIALLSSPERQLHAFSALLRG